MRRSDHCPFAAPQGASEAPAIRPVPAPTPGPDSRAAEAGAASTAEADHTRSGHLPNVNRHDARIHAFTLSFDASIDWNVFTIWSTLLLHARGGDVLRTKDCTG